MTVSFSRSADEKLLALLEQMRQIGAGVEVVTRENSLQVTRTITASWHTHNTDARVLKPL